MTEANNFKPLSGIPGSVYGLAVDIDQFMENFDTYEYRDDVDDREENARNIAQDIYEGKTDYLKKGLQEYIDDNRDPEQTETAESLLRRLNLIRCNH